jgi:hypothetical protein
MKMSIFSLFKSRFPKSIKIQVVGKDGQILRQKDIFIIMQVKSGTRNPYHIQLPFTNEKGVTSITRQEVAEQMDSAQRYYIMDYNGDIGYCEPVIELSLFDYYGDKDGFIRRKRLSSLSQYEKKRWESIDEVVSYILSNKNNGWVAHKTIDLSLIDKDEQIKLELNQMHAVQEK